MVDASKPTSEQVARSMLQAVAGRSLPIGDLADLAVELAKVMLSSCEKNTTHRDREQAEVLGRMMGDRRGQVFTTLLTDRAYRTKSMKRAVEQARYLLEKIGPPEYLGPVERLSLAALRRVGSWVPTLSGTAMLNRIEAETSAFVLPAGDELEDYLEKRAVEGTMVNVNHLGEEVLGDDEAQRRLQDYLGLLARPSIETLSVKVSSIDSQLSPFAFNANVRRVSERLQTIYRAAIEHRRRDGKPKLVTLDMEAYRDARLTLMAFKDALEQPEFLELTAGIALQAYLPETVAWHRELLDWSRRRRERGGAPIRTRLVKGANLAVEKVESNIRGWPNPIYPSKREVDANYKRVLRTACLPENVEVAQVGVGSHNLFDVCFALLLSAQNGVSDGVSFELLEGMAEPLRRSLQQVGATVLVYTPIVGDEEFPSAIAYLVRRLDENTAPENYLAQSFSMRVDGEAWCDQEKRFRAACELVDDVSAEPRRSQDRTVLEEGLALAAEFDNERDTDFTLPHNRRHFEQWLSRTQAASFQVCSVIGGVTALGDQRVDGFDPSRPGEVPYEIYLATESDIERAIACAQKVHTVGAARAVVREQWLSQAATALRRGRAELVSLMVLDAGKRVEEADVEVSEAIDFAEYYLRAQRELERDSSVSVAARGPVVVTPPWNFPLAIPMGGVFGALVAGNPVIIKPALETPLVVQRACEFLWEAGVPRDVLQLVVCEDDAGSRLIRDERVRAVVLTGATRTAELFLEMRPDLTLFAETGGKNPMYVSAMSDHEQAIGDVVASAFGHAGQKCSALSQLILDRELSEDRDFLATLADATRSLRVGSAWNAETFVTPMIQPPNDLQRRALTQLEPGESWLVEPHFDPENPRLVSPGIKLGVQPGSFTHTTEFFCPMLGVLVADDVREGVEIANATRYGLTAGIHSLDEREHEVFIDGVQAGNVYVNRKITGAVVRRQSFGGWKCSSFGPGAKAGGPNYVAQFNVLSSDAEQVSASFSEADAEGSNGERGLGSTRLPPRVATVVGSIAPVFMPADRAKLRALAERFTRVHTLEFASGYDASQLLGEDNVFRYRPSSLFLMVLTQETSAWDLALTALAAAVAECPVRFISVEGQAPVDLQASELMQVLPVELVDGEAALLQCVESSGAERIRYRGTPPEAMRRVAREHAIHITTGAPLASGRWELLHYLREQAVSLLHHRYGHLGLRG